jgi:hypothetical protein
MDRRIIPAASNALGYDVDEDRVTQALEGHEGTDTKALRKQLRERVAAFEEAGGVAVHDISRGEIKRMRQRGQRSFPWLVVSCPWVSALLCAAALYSLLLGALLASPGVCLVDFPVMLDLASAALPGLARPASVTPWPAVASALSLP